MRYTHLQVHSHYSLLAGTASVEALAARAAADGLTHLALTDTNALYGAVAFARACRSESIEPIIGMTLKVAPLPGAPVYPDMGAGELVLLADGHDGYRSLCRLSTAMQGKPDREERNRRGIDWRALRENSTGLICISGGRRGWIERAVVAGDMSTAARYAGHLAGLFGAEMHLALERHPRHPDPDRMQALDLLSARFGLPMVAMQPIYCLSQEDLPILRLLAAIDLNVPLVEVPDPALPHRGDADIDVHWPDPPSMEQRFAELPAALARTREIAARCRPALPDGSPIWPVPRLPAGLSPRAALEEKAAAGLAKQYGSQPSAAVTRRLSHELDAIDRSGFTPLFLVVAELVGYARRQGIPVSTRGSVADSLAAYCTGITTVDPVEHDLLFERFLNPARTSLPDIDLDFCSRRRDEVLDYVRRRYGEKQVALVATVSTMRPKSAVRETAKAHGLDDATIARLIKLLPGGWHPDPRRRDRRGVEEVIAQIAEPALQRIIRTAYSIVGQPHHLSIHPGGVVITPGPLTDVVPLQWTPKGFLITQFDHGDVEAIGLPKLDLLGIRALTVLADAAELVRVRQNAHFALDAIPLDDPTTGTLLAQAETIGVFQCESTGAQRTLRQLKAHTVQDLAVANAFFKPGPATGGMAAAFVRRYRGEEDTDYLHPSLAPILRRTQGVLLFQEQILRIAVEIAGLSWSEADHLRRGMSKFEAREMTAIRDRFIAGCCRAAPDGPAFTRQQAETLWQQVEAFAGYGFNQGHATAYADVSYRSAYVKAHWPAEFLCARLQDWGGFHHQAIYIAEAQQLGIRVRPPHVNHSDRRFTLSDDAAGPLLWMGLGQVRDLRRRAIAQIIAARQEAPFLSLRDLLQRVPLQAKELTHLIQCGGVDGLGASRAALLAEAGDLLRAGSAAQLAFDFATETVPAESKRQRLDWEQHVIGQPLSIHPAELAAPSSAPRPQLRDLPALVGRTVEIAATRLPGWTGGKGYFLGDPSAFVVAVPAAASTAPRPWQPLLVRGRWQQDDWGDGWFRVDGSDPV